MEFRTIKEDGQVQEEIKKSRFICHAKRVYSEEEARDFITAIKKEHYKATHNCSAFIIGERSEIKRTSDDGEPSGTAGKPILNVLQHKGIGNCVVIVVRYFGGIKLGAGGLTRAYSSSAQAVVDNMNLHAFVPLSVIMIETDFANESFVRHTLDGFNATILKVDYGKNVVLTVEAAQKSVQALSEKIGFYGAVKASE